MRIKPPALPDGGRIAVVAPSSPPRRARRSSRRRTTHQARLRGGVRTAPPRGSRLPRRHRRAPGGRPPVGALGARHRHGPHARRRLRRRAAVPADRLGRARRPAHRLRLLRHHRHPSRRSPCTGRGQRSTARTSWRFTRSQGRAHGTRPRSGSTAPSSPCSARPRVRGSRESVRADDRRRGAPRRRSSAAGIGRCGGHSIGTPYELQTDGCILMIEDLDEEPYMVDAGSAPPDPRGQVEGRQRASCSAPTSTFRGRTRSRSTSARASRSRRLLDELIAPLGIPAIANVPGRPRQAHGDDPARRHARGSTPTPRRSRSSRPAVA